MTTTVNNVFNSIHSIYFNHSPTSSVEEITNKVKQAIFEFVATSDIDQKSNLVKNQIVEVTDTTKNKVAHLLSTKSPSNGYVLDAADIKLLVHDLQKVRDASWSRKVLKEKLGCLLHLSMSTKSFDNIKDYEVMEELIISLAKCAYQLDKESKNLKDLANESNSVDVKVLRKLAKGYAKESKLLLDQVNWMRYRIADYCLKTPLPVSKEAIIDDINHSIEELKDTLTELSEESEKNGTELKILLLKDKKQWLNKQKVTSFKNKTKRNTLNLERATEIVEKMTLSINAELKAREQLRTKLHALHVSGIQESNHNKKSINFQQSVQEVVFTGVDLIDLNENAFHGIEEICHSFLTASEVAAEASGLLASGPWSMISLFVALLNATSEGKDLLKVKNRQKVLDEFKTSLDEYHLSKENNTFGKDTTDVFFDYESERLEEEAFSHGIKVLGSGSIAAGSSLLFGSSLLIGGLALTPSTGGLGIALSGCGLLMTLSSLLDKIAEIEDKDLKKEKKKQLYSKLAVIILEEQSLVEKDGREPVLTNAILSYLKMKPEQLFNYVLKDPLISCYI